MTSLAEELLGGSRTAVLATLLLRPDEALHVRELARLTGISAGTLHRELRLLSELGLLIRRETGRQVFYSADRASPVFEELAGLLRKTAGLADVPRTVLARRSTGRGAAPARGRRAKPARRRAPGKGRRDTD